MKKLFLLITALLLSVFLFCSPSFASSPAINAPSNGIGLHIVSTGHSALGNYVVFAPATGGSYATGASNPSDIAIYYPNVWSSVGTWDLTNVGILAGHTVAGVAVTWHTFPTYGFSGFNLALFDGSGNGYYLPFSGVEYNDFVGESCQQKWTTQFWVSSWNQPGYPLYVYPTQLTIWYN
ncbi:MAG: hypothetical protein ABSA18_07800 [Dehalococcoidia bacterium]